MLDIEAVLENKQKTPYRGRELTEEERQRRIDPYRPSKALKYAVNLAILLEKRPLLLKGEPGSGKTCLARAVANELKWEYEPWYIKSTTIAQDGLYRYDSVRRLQDTQLAGGQDSKIREAAIARLATSEAFEEYNKDTNKGNVYLRYGPLGKAFTNDKPTVVLIDEIDKADIDFPNDLLRELNEGVLRIEEIGQEKKTKHPPLIFVTSNDEKDLPDAFLRRCLFRNVEFPDSTELIEIIKLHHANSDQGLIEAAVERFCKLRVDMGTDKGKKVSTAELLDWYTVLVCNPDSDVAIKALELSNNDIPYPEVLLKRLEDWRLLDR
jgi:MoxR-like ATPase